MSVREIHIPKGNGRMRTVYAPDPILKAQLRNFTPALEVVLGKILTETKTTTVPHGCRTMHSPVTMALPHTGPFSWTVSMDLKDAFDSCGHLIPVQIKKEYKPAFISGRPPQGFPSSPVLCNIALARLDKAICRYLHKLDKSTSVKLRTVYTRYVDDMAVSGSDTIDPHEIVKKLTAIISRLGLKVSTKKTRVQLSKAGRRIIVGVSVGNENADIRIPHNTRRRLRAANHNAERSTYWRTKRKAQGLQEWAKLKKPSSKNARDKENEHDDTPAWIKQRILEAKVMAKKWKLRINRKIWDEIAARQVPDEFYGKAVITSDPVYILGAATITNGWKSCLKQPTGQYRRSTVIWARLTGARVAYLPSKSVMKFDGVTRNKMAARCWIWDYIADEDSDKKIRTKYRTRRSHRIYGGLEAADNLRHILHDVAIPPTGVGDVVGSVEVANRHGRTWTEGGIHTQTIVLRDFVTKRQRGIRLRFTVS